jgi:hypothetical protein
VTISDLPRAKDLLQNVNRWLGQLGQPPITEGQLDRLVQTISVEGHDVPYVLLPGDRPEADGILAIVVSQPNHTWFFKMKGATGLLGREKDNFEKFVRSVRFR